ncbi:hypothetical protein PCE1_001156 [Barthelona sp. PCE]
MDQIEFIRQYQNRYEPHYEAIRDRLGTVTSCEANGSILAITFSNEGSPYEINYHRTYSKCFFAIYCGIRTLQNSAFHLKNYFFDICEKGVKMNRFDQISAVKLLNSLRPDGNIMNVIAFMIHSCCTRTDAHEFVQEHLDIFLDSCAEDALKHLFHGLSGFVGWCCAQEQLHIYDRCFDYLSPNSYRDINIDSCKTLLLHVRNENEEVKSKIFKDLCFFSKGFSIISLFFDNTLNENELLQADLPGFLRCADRHMVEQIVKHKYIYRTMKLCLNSDFITDLWVNLNYHSFNACISIEEEITDYNPICSSIERVVNIYLFNAMFDRGDLEAKDVVNFCKSIVECNYKKQFNFRLIDPRLFRLFSVYLLQENEIVMLKDFFNIHYQTHRNSFFRDLFVTKYENSDGWGDFNTLNFIPHIQPELFNFENCDRTVVFCILEKYSNSVDLPPVDMVWSIVKASSYVLDAICENKLIPLFFEYMIHECKHTINSSYYTLDVLRYAVDEGEAQKEAALKFVKENCFRSVCLDREIYHHYHTYFHKKQLNAFGMEFRKFCDIALDLSNDIRIFVSIIRSSNGNRRISLNRVLEQCDDMKKNFFKLFTHFNIEEFRYIFEMSKFKELLHSMSHPERSKVLKKMQELKISPLKTFYNPNINSDVVVYSDCRDTEGAIQRIRDHHSEQDESCFCIFLNNSALGAVSLEASNGETTTTLHSFEAPKATVWWKKCFDYTQWAALVLFLLLSFSFLHWCLDHDTSFVENTGNWRWVRISIAITAMLLIYLKRKKNLHRFSLIFWISLAVYVGWLIYAFVNDFVKVFSIVLIAAWIISWHFPRYDFIFLYFLGIPSISTSIFNMPLLEVGLFMSIASEIVSCFLNHSLKKPYLVIALILGSVQTHYYFEWLPLISFGCLILFSATSLCIWKFVLKKKFDRDIKIVSLRNETKTLLQYEYRGSTELRPITEINKLYIIPEVQLFCNSMKCKWLSLTYEAFGYKSPYVPYDLYFKDVEKHANYDIFGINSLLSILDTHLYVKTATLFVVSKISIRNIVAENLVDRIKKLSRWKLLDSAELSLFLFQSVSSNRVFVLRIIHDRPAIVQKMTTVNGSTNL